MPESTERKYHIWYEIIKADALHFGKKEQLSVDPAPKPASPAVPPVVIGITGHRPYKLATTGESNGYDPYNALRVRIREEVQTATQLLIERATVSGRSDRYANALHCASYLHQVKWRSCTPWTPDNLPCIPIALSGMALGVDQDAVKAWLEMAGRGPAIVAVVPFPGQEKRWPKQSQQLYNELREWVVGTVYVSEVAPKDDAEARCMMHARDEWVCCAADEMIAVYDGTAGGTGHTFNYWQRLSGPRAIRIDPRDLRAELDAKAEHDGARFRALSKDEQLAEIFGEHATEDDDIPF